MGRFFSVCQRCKNFVTGSFFGIVMRAAVPYARTSSRRKSSHARRNIVPSQKMQLKANSP